MVSKTGWQAAVVMAAGALCGFAAAQDPERVINFTLLVPADAVVTIDDNPTREAGAARQFQTPPLPVGREYRYTVRASAGGKTVTRPVVLRHGERNTFDLRPDFADQAAAPTSGSPDATASIDGRQLPPPDPTFGGVIKNDALQSTPWWAPRVVPPKGAPNVLLIITDDAGFGVPSTFGGVIPTPTMDRVAANGLRYNRMFSTALCSPTRAALITGRNHHSAGFGVVSEQSTGFPGYNSVIDRDKATIGRILKDNGYSTAWFGKEHNTPTFQASQVGPFDQWPIGMGFEYFYGFVGGDSNQWEPNLFRNTTQIYPFKGQPPGKWNLITAMADDAIDYMNRMHQIDPAKPVFIKYAPGATHAPHHPTKEWVEKSTR